MLPPITLLDRLQQLGLLLFVALLIFVVGVAILKAIGQSSPTKLRHGKYVLGWMLAGWLAGSAFGVCLIDNQEYHPTEADLGMAAFGLLLGWATGMIHGGIAILLTSRTISLN
jgi:hypothetical protein